MRITTSPMVARYQSSGRLQKPFTTKNTPLPVMFGAMAVCSMRYGVSDANHLRALLILRFINFSNKFY